MLRRGWSMDDLTGQDYKISVPGDPKGQPRPRACFRGGKVRMYDPGTADAWKRGIVEAARAAGLYRLPVAPWYCIYVLCYVSRPKSHFTPKGGLKPGADVGRKAVGKPDVDNILKVVMDGLEDAGVFPDDKLVSRATITRLYAKPGEKPETHIFVTLGGGDEN